MNAIGGSEENHDAEFDLVEWVDITDSLTKLTYSGEKSIVHKAVSIIRNKYP